MIEDDFIIKLGMRLITLAAEGRYEEIVRITKGRHYAPDDVEFALSESEYPYRPIVPPPDHFLHFRYDPVGEEDSKIWIAGYPLCTAEEGRSDLEVRVTIDFASSPPEITLEEIDVP